MLSPTGKLAQRMRNLGLTLSEWHIILAAHDHQCVYCGSKHKLEPDHVIPLSRGGSRDCTNVVPACMLCNRIKATNPAEWMMALTRGGGFTTEWPVHSNTTGGPMLAMPTVALKILGFERGGGVAVLTVTSERIVITKKEQA